MDDLPDLPDLTALLGSRICHDLISPVGAIANGVELLLMTGTAASPEVALIAESVANANARIRFFRVAFGSAGPDQRMGRPEILSILGDITRGGRLTVDWTVTGDVPRPEIKLAFLMLQCLETAMPYGGRVTFTRADGTWQVRATAAKLKVDPELWARLGTDGPAANLTAAQVHFALLPAEVRRQKRRLKVDLLPAEIGMTL